MLVSAAPLFSNKLPLPMMFVVPLLVSDAAPPSTVLAPAPVRLSVAPLATVSAPVIVPPVHVVVPARLPLPLKLPDCSVRLLDDVTVPLNVVLVVIRFEPPPVNTVPPLNVLFDA